MAFNRQKRLDQNARKVGVTVRPSRRKGKKLDVIKKGKVVASIGQTGYKDYLWYLAAEDKGRVPKGTAKRKQAAYKARAVHRHRTGTPAYYAYQILWT